MTDPANMMPETAPSPLAKAQIIGTGRDGTEESNVLQTPEEQRSLYASTGAITPPLDPVSLAHLYEMSGALRSNIDAYAINVDGFGHRFEPIIDLKSAEGIEQVKLAMVQERFLGLAPDDPSAGDDVDKVINLLGKGLDGFENGDRTPDPGELPEPSDLEVRNRVASLRREMVRERLVVEKFFAFCTVDESFESLRMKTRQDSETTGNGFWEVLRNSSAEIVQFNQVPGFSVRLMPQERDAQTVQMSVRATKITPTTEPVRKRFRKYVQVAAGAVKGNQLVWFKEFGDPRIYSHQTGAEYADVEELEKKEPGVGPATELIHFKIHNARSPYGMPRWISEMLAVVGSRHAEEINLAYFENKSVPPMAILVSGGRLVQEDVTKLENFVKNEIRGKRNFHKIMILQSEGGDNSTPGLSTGRSKIEIKPLTGAHDDAQFMKYMERNTDQIGMVFRLSRLLRGDARDFNRATAQTSLEFTEQQVFGPLRKEFDYYMNRCILTALGVNYWKFVSKGPDFSDPSALLDALAKTAEANYLIPEELRMLAAKGFGVDFEKIDADWTTRPMALTLAGVSTAQTSPEGASARTTDPAAESDNTNSAEDNDLAKQAHNLIELQKHFAKKGFELTYDAPPSDADEE